MEMLSIGGEELRLNCAINWPFKELKLTDPNLTVKLEADVLRPEISATAVKDY